MRIAVLVSGGVDSAVALRMLAAAGHEVHAFYLKVWLADEMAHLGTCPWQEDLLYARAVCNAAQIPLSVVALQQAYHQHVVTDALAELAAGRTPSPDIGCNRHVKFGAFFQELERLGHGFERVATGHYARTETQGTGSDARTRLLRGVDPVKDQTYFLYRLQQAQLARLCFPLGGLLKSEVRARAHDLGLPNRDRPDSQGICFLGSVRYDRFVEASLGTRRGWIREARSGRRLGRHRGVWFHTIGQRRGLGLGGGPWYVVGKDVARDELWVAHGKELAAWHRRRFTIGRPHWIAGPPDGLVAGGETRLTVKVRHTPEAVGCEVRCQPPEATARPPAGPHPAPGTALEVTLERADPGLADGQPAVLYDGDVCLGGGILSTGADPRRFPTDPGVEPATRAG